MRVPEVIGVISSDDVRSTVDAIAEWQLPNGMVPWFPGGHADPWNHVEAAMALSLGGRRDDAERAFDWLVGAQRPDGSWHQYYLADSIEQDKLDANTIAYVSEAIDPISIVLGLTRRDLMGQALRFLLFGEGETGLMVYAILLTYWDWTPEEDVRPRIFLMSD